MKERFLVIQHAFDKKAFVIMGRDGDLMMLLDQLDEWFPNFTMKEWIGT